MNARAVQRRARRELLGAGWPRSVAIAYTQPVWLRLNARRAKCGIEDVARRLVQRFPEWGSGRLHALQSDADGGFLVPREHIVRELRRAVSARMALLARRRRSS